MSTGTGFNTQLANATPSNWTVFSNDGTTLVARNSETNETYTGTPQAFAALFVNAAEAPTLPRKFPTVLALEDLVTNRLQAAFIGDYVNVVETNSNWELIGADNADMNNWREMGTGGSSTDPNSQPTSLVVIGDSLMEGYDGLTSISTLARTSNVLTGNLSAALPGLNITYYPGQKLRLIDCGMDVNNAGDKNGAPKAIKVTAWASSTQFTAPNNGANAVDADFKTINGRRVRPSSTMPAASPITYAIMGSHGRMKLAYNASIPGWGYKHWNRAISRDVASTPSSRVLVQLGANDWTITGDANADAAAVYAYALPVLDHLRSLGRVVDLCSMDPVGLSYSGHAALNLRIPLLNNLLRQYCVANPTLFFYVDTYASMVSDIGAGEMGTTANWLRSDGLHKRSCAAVRVGKVISTHWEDNFAYSRRWNPETVEDQNPFVIGPLTNGSSVLSTNGYTGNGATGWTFNRSAGSANSVGAVVSRDDGTFAQEITVSNASGFSGLNMSYALPPGQFTPDSEWRFVFDYEQLNCQANQGNMTSVTGSIQMTWSATTINSYCVLDMLGVTSTGSAMVDSSGRFISEPFTIPTGAAITAITAVILWGVAGTTTTPGIVRFGNIHLVRTK
jgi:hypothetical protein